MQIQELILLREYSYIDPAIMKKLKSQGYHLKGRGVDQAAFLTPNKQFILKVFGTGTAKLGSDQWRGSVNQPVAPGKPGKEIALNHHQRMAIYWADYCSQRKNNPFLPRFYQGENNKPYAKFV